MPNIVRNERSLLAVIESKTWRRISRVPRMGAIAFLVTLYAAHARRFPAALTLAACEHGGKMVERNAMSDAERVEQRDDRGKSGAVRVGRVL